MAQRLTFEQWRRKVEDRIVDVSGLSSEDLPDRDYTGAYDDGIDPNEFANDILSGEGFEDIDDED